MACRAQRILYLTPAWPHGRSFGGQLRSLNVGRALKQLGEVTVLNVGSDARDAEAMRQTETEFMVLPPVIPEAAPNRSMVAKVQWAVDTKYLNLHGVVAQESDRSRVASYLREFDLIWVLNSRTPNILQHWLWPRAHLDLDDIPSTYERAAARTGANVTRRWKARIQQSLLHRRERLFEKRFVTLSVCSQADRAYLGNGDRIHVIPNGFPRPAVEPVRNLSPTLPRIGFIGLYSYAPNIEGLRWFLAHCWPAIRRELPGVRLRMIGKDTNGPDRPTEPDVDALGWVADPTTEIATWSAMIIPIRLGGGTRIKIAEAFSRKCPVVSTHFGAFGYEVSNGTHLLLADKPDEFSRACVDLIRNPAQGSALAEEAWREFLVKWTWDAIAPKIWNAAEDCLRRSRTN